MGKRAYTVLIVSQKAAKVKKIIFSPLSLKIAGVVLGILIAVSSIIFYKYVTYKKKVAELQVLRAETNSQQEEMRSFMERINLLEEQLNKLKEIEKQIEKDLKEITELKKSKKPSPRVLQKKSSDLPKEAAKRMTVSFPEEQVSVLEKERPRLLSRLHQDLIELRIEYSRREHNFKELREALQTQKSLLLATPSLWPVLGRITSHFGESRVSPSSGGTRPHRGIDISVPPGTPISAPADGEVTFAGRESEYGRLVCLDHGHGFTTAYGHLNAVHVQAGDRVKKGQVIGTVGLSGNTTGPHLHYEVRIQGNPVNPFHYLNQSS